MASAKAKISQLLALADVGVDGARPWDMQVHNQELFQRILAHGTLGLGEAYMEGWWDCAELDQFFCKVTSAQLGNKLQTLEVALAVLKAKVLNQQTRGRAKKVARQHYDLGNDFYRQMLDPHMQYTCAYWKSAWTLEQAQEAKLDLICRKLQLRPGERVLELGCGWGGFARFAASRYGCHVTAYNISEEQVAFAREFCRDLPVEVVHADYRDATGEYDKVAAIGIMEHVGYRNYRNFAELAHARLRNSGLFMLHTIGGNVSRTFADPWINQYIFPNSMLPSVSQVATAIDGLFVLEDWHSFGPYYDQTLMAWFANFDAGWPAFRERYGDTFYRMWIYYLLSCAGAFRARSIQLWQVVLSKGGMPEGYASIR